MPAGFQVFNADNILTIDESYKNHSLRRSGRLTDADFTTHDAYINERNKVAEIDIAGLNNPILVIKNQGRDNAVGVMRTPLGLPTTTGVKLFVFAATGSTTITQVDWFLFDDWTPNYGGNVGLEVLNAQGQRVFHSDWYMLRVLSAIVPVKDDVASFYGVIGGRDFLDGNGPSGKDLGFFCAPTGLIVLNPNASTFSSMFGEFMYFSGTQLRHRFGFFYEDDPPFDAFPVYRDYIGPRNNQVFIIDVSNIPIGLNLG